MFNMFKLNSSFTLLKHTLACKTIKTGGHLMMGQLHLSDTTQHDMYYK